MLSKAPKGKNGMTKPVKLNAQEEWIVKYLKGSHEWVSPTAIGQAYGGNYNSSSAWASPKCKRLVEKKLLKRNAKGHYKLVNPGKPIKKKVTEVKKPIKYCGLCYKCVHLRSIPGDAHSRCNNFSAKAIGPTGIRSGWFSHPLNFDPVWLTFCDGFSDDPKKNKPEQKLSPLAELLAILC